MVTYAKVYFLVKKLSGLGHDRPVAILKAACNHLRLAFNQQEKKKVTDKINARIFTLKTA